MKQSDNFKTNKYNRGHVSSNFFIFPAAAQRYIWSACTDRSFSSTLLLRDAEGHISPKKVIITTAGALIEIAPIVGLIVEAAKYIFSKPQTMPTPLIGALNDKINRIGRIRLYFLLASTSWVITDLIFKYLKSNVLQDLTEECKNNMDVAALEKLGKNPDAPANLRASSYLSAAEKNLQLGNDSAQSFSLFHQAYALKDQATLETQKNITNFLHEFVIGNAVKDSSTSDVRWLNGMIEHALLSPELVEFTFREFLRKLVDQKQATKSWVLEDDQYEKIKKILHCFSRIPLHIDTWVDKEGARTNPEKFEEILNHLIKMRAIR